MALKVVDEKIWLLDSIDGQVGGQAPEAGRRAPESGRQALKGGDVLDTLETEDVSGQRSGSESWHHKASMAHVESFTKSNPSKHFVCTALKCTRTGLLHDTLHGVRN